MQLTTLLALALSMSASATSISTFRTAIRPPAPTVSPSASPIIIDTPTPPMIDTSMANLNFTVPQRGAGGPARPESLCHGISPMCYAIAHGKRDCYKAWMVCFLPPVPPPLFFVYFYFFGGVFWVWDSLTLGRREKYRNSTTKPTTAIIPPGYRALARRCWSVVEVGKWSKGLVFKGNM